MKLRIHCVVASLGIAATVAVAPAWGQADVPRGLVAVFAPAFRSVAGPDYDGVKAGIGFDAGLLFHAGTHAIGVGYLRSGHAFDVPGAGEFDPTLTIRGPYAEYRKTFIVDPDSKPTLFISVRAARLTQAVEVSASSTSVSVDTDGVGFGMGVGVDIPVSRTVDLILEGAWLLVQFDEFALLETSEVESSTRGMEFALKLGVRARIARLLGSAR